MSALSVAAVQVTSTQDVAANLARCADLTRAAAAAGASLVGLPENFAFLGSDLDHRISLAEVLPGPGLEAGAAPGPILSAMQALARQTETWLLLGGFPERAASSAKLVHNTSILLRADGSIAATYRKIHLFDVDVPGGKRFRESESIEPGDDLVTADTPWGPLGLTICYDLRFPELYRALTARGARMIAVPSAFTLETGKDHWNVLLRARAIENQAYVFAPAQFGHHGGNRHSWGHAMVVDPWGAVLAECGDHEGFALAPIDFEYQGRVRESLPCLTHRRVE